MKNELINHQPGFSVVISTYNRIDNLLKLVEQLLQQKDLTCSYEILIVNDNGPEEYLQELYSSPILKSSPVSIRLFNTFYDGYGLALARNIGLRFAEYDNVVFLDDDLEIANHFLHYYQQAPYGVKAGRIDFEVEVNAETHQIPDYRPVMEGKHTQVLPAENDILGMVWGGNMSVPTMLFWTKGRKTWISEPG
jgi:glycosyltransferase involved in cell wall biosynthesis